MTTVDLPLLPLGRGTDLNSERGVECPGDLPAASDPDLVARALAAKEALGSRVFVLGHHYQRDEAIQLADVTGDSFKLARASAAPRPRGWSCPTWGQPAGWQAWPGSVRSRARGPRWRPPASPTTSCPSP